MINLRLDGTVRTLMLTLRARAEEQEQPEPLIQDKWAADWYKFMPEVDLLDEWYNAPFQLATAIRSRLIDEAVDAFLDSHDNPLVIELGAGFSTRYFRQGEGRSHWIELDLDEAIVARRKIDLEVERHWFIASDMTDMSWIDLLPEHQPDNVLLIAEGALMFLEPSALEDMFKTLADQLSGATFVFDVVNPDYIERTNTDFADINAPMQWGVAESDLGKYGLKVNDVRYLLVEFDDRWDAIGIDGQKRTKDRSGYVVSATLG